MWLGNLKAIRNTLVRYYSRKAAVNVRKINPKVPTQQAYSIAQSLYDIIKQNGPLSVSNTWIQAKLLCDHVGNTKKFLHTTLPEEPRTDKLENEKEKEKPRVKKRKKHPVKKGKKLKA
ncbi:hypothetical protein Pint_14938 [Pistacia integerrima]|uniref:Uncharacterized protein n=1 Tax=Pistacia integerrima TaxID=434235 RepID=A0ACC0Z8I8_9ROSI|nr:hypothetical protein Pint_14938 [Pistacia integerrima]